MKKNEKMKAKRLLLSLLALPLALAAWADIQINESTFPDELFRSYILSQTYGEDGILTGDEIEGVTFIFATERGFQSLKGIEYFTSLTSLYCSGNQLTELDVSALKELTSLICSSNQLTSLNVAGCAQLLSINISQNQIKGEAMALIEALPDRSTADERGGLYAIYGEDDGNQITDAQVIAAHEKGWTSYYSDGWDWYEKAPEVMVNETTFPDANFRSYVMNLYGQTLTSAEINGAKYINVNDKGIKSLKGIEYFTALTSLYCYNNQMTELDLSQNTALTDLYCYNNRLAKLDLSKNTQLTILSCYQNRIKGEAMDALIESLPDLSSSQNGIMLAVYSENEGNKMSFAQAAAAKAKGWTPKYDEGYTWTEYQGSGEDVAINEENFPDENFRAWILSQNYGADGVLQGSEILQITYMNVSDKGIQSLKGIEHFAALTTLACTSNQLTELDLSKNAALKTLSCNNNQLTSLNLSACRSLTTLYCYQNAIDEDAMESLVESLPTVNEWDGGTLYVIYGDDDQNVINTLQVAAAKEKGWQTKHWDNLAWDWVDYAGSIPIGIKDIKAQPSTDDIWYDLSGHRLQGKPTQKGIYIVGGKKVILR